jgi:hypothetical protein
MHTTVSSAARRVGRPASACLAAAGLAFALAGLTTVSRAATPALPEVTGPVPVIAAPGDPSRDYPYVATVDDLARYGYIEEEYIIEGAASRYTTPQGTTGTIVDTGHPYRSRVIVRRPASPRAFNGTAVVEWNNVTPGHDLDIDWLQSHDYWMRSGYAWIGVSAQRVGVDALRRWNPRRYGTLDVSHGGTLTNDELSYDVFGQVAQAVRAGAGRNGIRLLGDLRVTHVFATGHSQSASRLATYVNSVHPLVPVFDAVVVHGGGDRIRDDLGRLKVWKLMAETDVISRQAALRQPDTSSFRLWEVAGTSHVDQQFVASSRRLSARDDRPPAARTTAPPAAPPPSPCDRPPYSHIPFHHVMNAAFEHLQRWVTEGTLPPSAPPIQTSSVGPPATVVRDARGNALGGIRLAAHAVPTGVNTGQNSGPGFCRLNGSHADFPADVLAELYPTHDAYVAAVREAVRQNLEAGYILQADADATIAAAEASPIGRR